MIPTPVTQPDPLLGDAKRLYVEQFGSPLVWNTYLKIFAGLSVIVALGAIGLNYWTSWIAMNQKPIVLGVDHDTGRVTLLPSDVLVYQPHEPELKYFLTQFITAHYSRRRATVRETYPQSFIFLDATVADSLMARANQTQEVEKFLVNTADEIQVEVMNVTLTQLKTQPFHAAVDYRKIYLTNGTRLERRREAFIAQIDFILRDHTPANLIPINPLGLTITDFREDPAFQEITQP
jgi:hypothetical protein